MAILGGMDEIQVRWISSTLLACGRMGTVRRKPSRDLRGPNSGGDQTTQVKSLDETMNG